MTKVSKVSYGGWENCIKIENHIVKLIITADVGPRIIYYGFLDGENEFCEVKEDMGLTGGDQWRIYGGHRLWHSPEAMPRSYYPDNNPCKIKKIENGIAVSQKTEPTTYMKKDIEVTLDSESSAVNVKHMITNKGLWDVEMAVWALTVMATGGTEIVPQNTNDTGLLANRMLSLWPYTKLNDPRVYWGEKYIFLKQDPKNKDAFKFGMSNDSGWAAYANNNNLFVKRFSTFPDALYPDYSGSSYETYTNDFMLEMESLSPLFILEPSETIEHIECWELYKNIPVPKSEDDVENYIVPIINKT